jgi:chromosome segregation ATPase
MISLEQVRQLDIRVKKAVSAVKTLSAENSALKQQISELEARLDELRREASDRQANEQEIEVGLQGVLDVLDEVDGETADVEPEPPAENYVIETVQDEKALDVSEDVAEYEEAPSDSQLFGENSESIESESEPAQDGQSVELPPDPETDDSDDEEEGDTPDDSENQDESELKKQTPVEDSPPESNEDIDLEKDDQDLSGGDEDRFQSEFDIF